MVKPNSILMTPLHAKFSVMNQNVEALRQDHEAFRYLNDFFLKLFEAKIKANIFFWPHIKKIMAATQHSSKISLKQP